MPEPQFQLWDHQHRMIAEAEYHLRRHPSLLTTAPPGSGKTVVLAEIMARAHRKNHRVALLVHRQELVNQSCEKISRQTGQEPGVVWQSRREWNAPLLVLAQSSLTGHEIPPAVQGLPLLIIDEAHHTVAPGWLNTLAQIRPRYLLGFSATPFRQDREPLSPEPFAQVTRPVTPHQLIEAGILTPAVIESPIIFDHYGNPQPINQASNIEYIYRQAVRYALARGRSKIILYVSSTREDTPLQVVDKTTAALRADGISAFSIDENFSSRQRDATLTQFQTAPGASVLVNYLTLTEGADLPYVDCVIIGRHTDSESTIIQMIGRGLRKHPAKKDCLVLNYTNRTDIDDIIHYWRLDGLKGGVGQEPKKRGPRLSHDELTELTTEFPNRLSPLDVARIHYPWFTPFPKRPLLALALWSGPEDPFTYITVEPTPDGACKVSTIFLQNEGPSQLRRQQTVAPTVDDAATLVRIALKDQAPHLQRNAHWRLNPASEAQRYTWKRLHPGALLDPNTLTSGEASDAIAQERFQRRVNPQLV